MQKKLTIKDVACHGVTDESHKNVLHVDWQLLWACNYRCSYCYNQNKPVAEKFSLKESISTIDKLFSWGRPFYAFRLVGGEPTIHPYFIDIARHISSNVGSVGVLTISNGSKGINYYEKLIKVFPSNTFQFDLSIHVEFAKQDHILGLVELISSSKQSVNVRLMFHPGFRSDVVRFHEALTALRDKYCFSMQVRSLRNPPDFTKLDERYTNEDIEWSVMADKLFLEIAQKSSAAEIKAPDWGKAFYEPNNKDIFGENIYIPHETALKKGLKSFKDFYCCGGTNLINIDTDFSFRGGTCNLLKKYDKKIYSNDFKYESVPSVVRCTYQNCGCDANDVLPKFRDKARADSYVSEIITNNNEEIVASTKVLSFVMPAYNCEATIERALDSILLQADERIEILIVDDASTDRTREIIEYYVSKFKCIVKCIGLAKNSGAANARNIGINFATGRYIFFIDSDDLLNYGFVNIANQLLESTNFDIAIFSLKTRAINGVVTESKIESKSYALEERISSFLLREFGSYGPYSKLFNREFLNKHSIRFPKCEPHEDLIFNLYSLRYAEEVISLSFCAYTRICRSGSLSATSNYLRSFNSFVATITQLINFCDMTKINIESKFMKFCIETLYTWDRVAMLNALSRIHKNEFSDNAFMKLAKTKYIPKILLELLIRDYSIVYASLHNLSTSFDAKSCLEQENNIDFLSVNSLDWELYKKQSAENAPLFSLIISNYNKANYLQKCLDSVTNQTVQNFEIIIIDDSSTDSSKNILCGFADSSQRTTLYFMNKNYGQSTIQNFGLTVASGKYVLFVDADDFIDSNFMFEAQRIINCFPYDIVVFGVDEVDIDGNIIRTFKPKNVKLCGRKACTAYMAGLMPWGTWGKIYFLDFIRNNGLFFKHGLFHQDLHFLSKAMLSSESCLCVDKVVYFNMLTPNSSLRPVSWGMKHIHSAIQKLLLREELYASNATYIPYERFVNSQKWSIERRLLLPIFSYYNSFDGICLREVDYSALKSNITFIHALLKGFSTLFAEHPDFISLLPPAKTQKCSVGNVQDIPSAPLVSVIVPVHNQESLLPKCINSITTQYVDNIEIIIIDDSSTDNTYEVCLDLALHDNRIVVLRNDKQEGQGFSRNKGIDLSRGKYISFVDSDDYILPGFLFRSLVVLENNPEVDIVHFSCRRVDSEGKVIRTDLDGDFTLNGREAFSQFCTEDIKSFAVWSKVFRKSLLVDNGIVFNATLFEDNLFLCKAFLCSANVEFCKKIGYVYVQFTHECSAMNPKRSTIRHIKGIVATAHDLVVFSKKHRDSFPQIEELLDRKVCQLIWRVKEHFPWMSGFGFGQLPLDSEDIRKIIESPPLLKCILKDFSQLTSDENSVVPAVRSQVYDYRESADIGTRCFLNPAYFSSEKHFFTIIIYVYNAEKHIDKCISSLIDQSFTDFEVIICFNPHTSDSSLLFLTAICAEHGNFTLVKSDNFCSLASAYNYAILLARGRYVMFLGSCDWVDPSLLQCIYQKTLKDSSSLLFALNYKNWMAQEDDSYEVNISTLAEGDGLSGKMLSFLEQGYFLPFAIDRLHLKAINLEFYDSPNLMFIFAVKLLLFTGRYELVMQPLFNHETLPSLNCIDLESFGSTYQSIIHELNELNSCFLDSKNTLLDVALPFVASVFLKKQIYFLLTYIKLNENSDVKLSKVVQDLLGYEFSPLLVRHILYKYSTALAFTRCDSSPKVCAKEKLFPSYSINFETINPDSAKTFTNIVENAKLQSVVDLLKAKNLQAVFERHYSSMSANDLVEFIINTSECFDDKYYFSVCPDFLGYDGSPVSHYICFGALNYKDPADWFDTKFYLQTNSDVASEGINPFFHYLCYGFAEGRMPNPDV